MGASRSYRTKCVGVFRDDDVSWIVMVYLFPDVFAHFSFFSLYKKKPTKLHHEVDTSFTAETSGAKLPWTGHHSLRSSKLTSSTKTSKTQKARPGVT